MKLVWRRSVSTTSGEYYPLDLTEMLAQTAGMTKKLILVTGASRGLGYAVCKALASSKTHLIAIARTVGGLEELDDEVRAQGGSATLVPFDITDEQGLQNLGRSIHERWDKLDTLIHCAAHATPLSPVGHIAAKDMDKAWAVNARATQRLITMMDPLLKAASNGRAIYVDDVNTVAKHSASYRTSKLAARSFVDSWIAESVQTGPEISIFEAKPMPTALRARFYPGEDRSSLTSVEDEAKRLVGSL